MREYHCDGRRDIGGLETTTRAGLGKNGLDCDGRRDIGGLETAVASRARSRVTQNCDGRRNIGGLEKLTFFVSYETKFQS